MNKEFKSISKNVLISSKEDSADLEFQESLPQYCDDIERIVRCSCESVVTDYEYASSSIKVYGKSRISITYFSTQGVCRQTEFEEAFSKSIDCPQTEHFAFASIKCSSRFCNLRMINQRKVDVHSSVRILSRIYERRDCSPMYSCENTILKKSTVDELEVVACAGASVDFDQEFDLPTGAVDIETIINTFSSVTVEELKLIRDKMLVKSRVELSVTYISSENVPVKSAFSLNVSRIIDVDSIDESNMAFVSAAVSSLFVKAEPDDNNNMRRVQIAGGLTVSYCVMKKTEGEYIEDAYSTECVTNCHKEQVPLYTYPEYFNDTRTVVTTARCDDDDITEIIDINASITSCVVVQARISYEVRIDIIYYNSRSEIVSTTIRNELKMSLDDSGRDGIATMNLVSFDFVLKSADSLELRINAEYAAYLYTDKSVAYIADIEMSDEKNAESPVMTLYFADDNESVWEIAKKFHTMSQLIIDENDLTSDTVSNRRIILVPGV